MGNKKDDEMMTAGEINETAEVNINASSEAEVEVVEAKKAPKKKAEVKVPESPEKAGPTLSSVMEAVKFLAFKTLEPSEFKEFVKTRLGE